MMQGYYIISGCFLFWALSFFGMAQQVTFHYAGDKDQGPLLVEFGMPFPKGAARESPWETTLKWPDGSLRAVKVRTQINFGGRTSLALNWKDLQPEINGVPSLIQHDSPTWPGKYNIEEPIVWVTLPATYLLSCELTGPMTVLGTDPDMAWYDQWMVKYCEDTMRNNAGYLDSPAPWLFDRATTLWLFYLRSGELKYLQEAYRASRFYGDRINSQGYFSLKPGDAKYCYGENLLLYTALSGDTHYVPVIEKIAAVAAKFPVKHNPEKKTGIWTERHLAFVWLAQITAYEATLKPKYKKQAQDMLALFREHQLRPPEHSKEGQAPGRALYHNIWQHEGWKDKRDPFWVFSPWMSVLLVDAAERMERVISDDRLQEFILDLADETLEKGLYEVKGVHPEINGMLFPFYLSGPDGKYHDAGPWDDRQHTLDVARIPASAYARTGKQKYHKAYKQLVGGARYIVPRFNGRNKPPRKFSWWFKTTMGLSILGGDSRAVSKGKESSQEIKPVVAKKDARVSVKSTVQALTVTSSASEKISVSSDPKIQILKKPKKNQDEKTPPTELGIVRGV